MFRRRRPLFFRIWHWLNAVLILCIFATVIFRWGLLENDNVRAGLLKRLQELGMAASLDQTKEVLTTLSFFLWEWHETLGYILGFSLLLRFLVQFQYRHTKPPHKKSLHYKMVHLSYMAYYVFISFMVTSGLIMVFGVQLPEPIGDILFEIHENGFWVILAFALLHIAGVVMAERQHEDRGLVSEMLHG